MPKNIRAMLSVIVALVAAVTFYVEMQAGAGALKWVVLALAAFMIYAVWLFPEAKERKDNGG
jgi:zinc transporter ZupT